MNLIKTSFFFTLLLLLFPWINGVGADFVFSSQLKNPDRELKVNVKNGFFTYIQALKNGTVRKNRGLYGQFMDRAYYLSLDMDYLQVVDYNNNDYKRDLINVNNRFFSTKIEYLKGNEYLFRYPEEVPGEKEQPLKVYINGSLSLWDRLSK
ncbi:hypothetical protein [Aliivibrio fischeri]|uniref:hypothetical protein n=1 Tax=Aliivibrio fischeri TaxID=668 RepID=UPI0012DAF123|nr:hypothetical protein [Aliivibrio fischeri]MUJ39564.1 hypothetical protein [Aliivibrio fischeri]